MKTKILHIVLFFFLAAPLMAQIDTLWYDANWSIAEKAQASYFRPAPAKKGEGYWLIDYYISGTKQMEAYSYHSDTEQFNGLVTYYHENGNVWQTINYKDSIIHGQRKIYHLNGPLERQYAYENGKIEGTWIAYFENAKIAEEGNYVNDQRDGRWKEYHKNGKLKADGAYKKNKKIGDWVMHFYDGKLEDD